MISAGSLRAKGTIFGALLRHILVGWFLRLTKSEARSGGPWLRRIAAEDLAPTPAGSWEFAAATSRCIGCGLCDALAPGGRLPGPGPAGPAADAARGRAATLSEWMMGMPRRPQDAALALAQADAVEALADDIARICPAGVDPRLMVRLVRERAAVLAAARGRR